MFIWKHAGHTLPSSFYKTDQCFCFVIVDICVCQSHVTLCNSDPSHDKRFLGNAPAVNNISLQIIFADVLGRYVEFSPAEGIVGPVFTFYHIEKEANITFKIGEINQNTRNCIKTVLYSPLYHLCPVFKQMFL